MKVDGRGVAQLFTSLSGKKKQGLLSLLHVSCVSEIMTWNLRISMSFVEVMAERMISDAEVLGPYVLKGLSAGE